MSALSRGRSVIWSGSLGMRTGRTRRGCGGGFDAGSRCLVGESALASRVVGVAFGANISPPLDFFNRQVLGPTYGAKAVADYHPLAPGADSFNFKSSFIRFLIFTPSR